jgi:uncharacterized protein
MKLFLTSVLLATILAANTVSADEVKMNRIMSLIGHGEVRSVPDMAVVGLGVMTSAETARKALDANTAAMTELMASLKSANVEAKDIATASFSVNPRYDYGQNNGQPPKLIGYDVANSVIVTVHKIDSIGVILDKAVSSGSNQINGISFSISKPEAAVNEARKLAVKDARQKAELYAAATSTTLGNITAISESGPSFQPPTQVNMQAKQMSSDAANVPISQGEQVIGFDVNVSWEIK